MKKCLLQIITFFLMYCTYGQDIDSVMNTLFRHQPEKIYIHFDRDYYMAGETVWFKAYMYTNGKPSGASNNFYLQLIDEDGKVVVIKKYPVKGATVHGDISLPDSLRQGYYRIRAITPVVLNSSSDIYYTKYLYVFNPSSDINTGSSLSGQPALSVRFFPESGDLVDGINSVLAFSAVDSTGQPANISGIIKMDDSIKLSPFQTFHEGIGRVQLKPQVGKKYIAEINYKGEQHFFPLPEIQNAGINIKIDDEKGGKVFVVSRSRKEKEKFGKIFLLAEMDNKVVYESEVNFEDYYSVKGHLITDGTPSGILHFTAFNMDGIPLAERLTFVDNGEYRALVNIEVKKKGLQPRSENQVLINFPEIVQRSCSVAVTAIGDHDGECENTIVSSLLLTGELKGYIRNPSYYFNNPNDTTKLALDNLMLTYGWCRYNWKKLLSGDIQAKNIEDRYLISVNGSLVNSKTKLPANKGRLTVFLEPEDSINQYFETLIDESGNFRFDSLLFNGKTKFFYAYTNPDGKETAVDISLNLPPADVVVDKLQPAPLTRNIFDGLNIPEVDESDLLKRFGNPATGKNIPDTPKILEPVIVKSAANKRPLDEVNEKYTKGVFTAMGRSNFDLVNDPEVNKSMSVYDFIRRSVKQVTLQDDNFVNKRNFSLFEAITNEKDRKKQNALDSINAKGGLPPFSERYADKPDSRDPGKNYIVAIFVNESPSVASYLKTIRVDEVALIKYYEPGFIGAGGADGPGGAIAVYTKKDVAPPASLGKLDYVPYMGYSVTKEFYNPDYSIPSIGEQIKDARITLYWNPEMYTNDQTTSFQIRFFNNDMGQRWKIVFEGFDVNGKLVHTEKIVQ